jgi:hypothetical protein
MGIKAYIYHKKAEKYSDCQDYFEISSQNNRIAVSDGMSQSIYPQWWAEILAKSYIQNGKIPAGDVLTSCQNEWQKKVNDEVQRREDNGMNPWRLRNAIAEKSGAGATLCGLTCEADKWTCECIGDSCLILIRKDFCIKIYTSQDGTFGNNPDYLDSYTKGRGTASFFEGNYDDVELMLVATDPFSELFQKHASEPEFIKQLTEQLRQLSTHESFVELVERWRTEYQMHNDDSTIVIIDKFESQAFEISHEDNLAELAKGDESPAPRQKVVLHKKVPSNDDTSNKVAVENIQKAVSELLQHYDGKKSINKIFKWLKKFLDPIIKEFLKR